MSTKELDKPGPVTAREVELWGLDLTRRPLTVRRLQELYDHQRWLTSGGKFGEQLKIDQEGGGDRRNYVNYDLDGVNFSQAVFKHVGFVNCSLKGAVFSGAHLEYVFFLGCDVEGANFRGAYLNGSSDPTFQETNHQKALFDSEVLRLPCSRGGIEFRTRNRPFSLKI